jgi:hypothetical protein
MLTTRRGCRAAIPPCRLVKTKGMKSIVRLDFGKYSASIWHQVEYGTSRSGPEGCFRFVYFAAHDCFIKYPRHLSVFPSFFLNLLHLTGQKSCVPYSLQASSSRPTQPAIPPASKTHHALLYLTAGCLNLQLEPPSTMAEYHTTQPTSLVQMSRGQTLSVSPEEKAPCSTTAAPKQSK